MLRLKVPLTSEEWDEEKEEFVEPKFQVLKLEHSLLSLSKWESNWCKPFFSREAKTYEETIDYIKCMTLTQNVDPDVYNHLTRANIIEVNNYIDNPRSATTFSNPKTGPKSREIITSELIYYWMVALQIPNDYEKWHLNRLFNLIQICNIKNSPPKKRSAKEIMRDNAALNAQRKARLNTKG